MGNSDGLNHEDHEDFAAHEAPDACTGSEDRSAGSLSPNVRHPLDVAQGKVFLPLLAPSVR